MRTSVHFVGRWTTNAALACLAIASSTKPEDAMSNLSGWAALFHLPTPLWLQSHMADNVVFVVALSGIVLLAFGPKAWRALRKGKAVTPTLPLPAQRGPTLEATNRSRIDATGAFIPGDLPFQFGKAEHDSIIHMLGIEVTKNEDNTYTVRPGAVPVNITFPPPTGEFSNLSNPALNQTVQEAISELRQFNSNYRRDVFPPYTKIGPIPEEYTRRSNENWKKYQADYEGKFSKRVLSLTSEMLDRIGNIDMASMPESARHAFVTVYYGRFSGNDPAAGAADFLEAVVSSLPNK